MNKESRINFIAVGICAFCCCVWAYVLGVKYYTFGYWGWDLPLYANLMWNLCHGSVHTSLFGGNFLMDHFNGIAFFLIPFFYFFQSALTLLYIKLLAFFAGAYVFYLLASKRLGNYWGLAFMLAYLFYFPNIVMLFFEFNFENLVLPLFFILFYYFEEKKYLPFMVCCFLTSIVKENMPLVVLMFGIYGFLMRREDWVRWGLIPLALGAMMFWGEVFVITPWLRQGVGSVSGYLYQYSQIGLTPSGGFEISIVKLTQLIKLLFSSRNLSYLVQLFGPLWPALLSPQILLLGLPLFLQNLLSSFDGQQSMDYFYASTLTVFIFMAAVDFLGRINFKYKGYLLGLMVGILFVFDLWHIPQWEERMPTYEEEQDVGHFLLSKIPPDAKVFSTYNFLCFLSQRKDLYVFGRLTSPFTHRKDQIPPDLDYAVVDFSTRIDDKETVKQMVSQGQWTTEAAGDDDVLLRKNTGRGEEIIEQGKMPLAAEVLHPGINWGSSLVLDAVEVPSSLRENQRIMRVAYYWKALGKDWDESLPHISLSIVRGQETIYYKDRVPLYGLPFEKNEYDRDAAYYFIPELKPGDYQVEISSSSFPQGGQMSGITRPLHVLN